MKKFLSIGVIALTLFSSLDTNAAKLLVAEANIGGRQKLDVAGYATCPINFVSQCHIKVYLDTWTGDILINVSRVAGETVPPHPSEVEVVNPGITNENEALEYAVGVLSTDGGLEIIP